MQTNSICVLGCEDCVCNHTAWVLTAGHKNVGVCGEEPWRTGTAQHTRQEVVLLPAGPGNVKSVRWREETIHGMLYRNKCELTFKWKWRDIRPSLVNRTRNSCSAFNPSKVNTHTAVHTHTPWTHTRSSSLGFGALLKGTSVVVLRVERALYIHPPTYNSCQPARDSNPQPLAYESDSLTIKPRLPQSTNISSLRFHNVVTLYKKSY